MSAATGRLTMYILLGSLAVLCALSAASVAAAASGSVAGVDPEYYRKSEEAAYASSLMTKILQDTRQTSELIRLLQSLVRQKVIGLFLFFKIIMFL